MQEPSKYNDQSNVFAPDEELISADTPVIRSPGLAPERVQSFSEKTLGKIKNFQVIGVYAEGATLRIAKVARGANRIEIEWLKSFNIPTTHGAPDTIDLLDSGMHVTDEIDNDSRSLDIEAQKLVQEGTGAYLQLVDLTEGGTIPLALAVSEPDIFYNQFDTNWGLRGKYLQKKVVGELGLSKKGNGKIDQGEIRLVQMNNKRLLSIYCGRNLPFYSQLDLVKKYFHRKIPKIALVESVELSLVNLVNDYFSPGPGSITIIVNVAPQSTRFTIMVGDELFHLSQLINDGLDSPTLPTTLLNRLQFELDNMSIRKVDDILVTGLAGAKPIIDLLSEHFPKAHVRPLRPHSLDLSRLEHKEVEDFSAYAPALGAALRLLDPQMDHRYHVDLTPAIVRDRQNRLSLSAAGWLLLLSIPLLLAGILYQASHLNWELKRSKAELIPKLAQIESSKDMDHEIEMANARLAAFDKAEALLDSLDFGALSFGSTLAHLMQTCKTHSGSWFTEISSSEAGKLKLVGYSLTRSDIPNFVRENGAEISTIEAQEIRSRTVYRFEIESPLQVASN